MATIKRVDGFETGIATPIVTSGDLGLYSGEIVAGVSIQNSIKRSGDYAVRLNKVATSNQYIEHEHLSETQNVLVASFYIYFTTFPGTSDDDICFVRLAAGVNAGLKINYSTKKIYARFWGTSSGTPVDVVLTTGQWYRIDWKVNVSANPNTNDVQVDGTATTQLSLAQAATTITNIGYGSTNSNTSDVYYDDTVESEVAGDYPIGEHAVIGLRPTGDGTHNAGTNVMEDQDGADIGVVTAYTLLDENPFVSTDADYIKQSATGDYYAEITFADTTYSTILGVNGVLQYNSSGAVANTAACSLIDEDTTETEIYGKSTSLRSYATTTLSYRTNTLPTPAGGWDAAAVNAIKARCGYSNNIASVPYWHAVMLQVGVSGSEAPCVNVVTTTTPVVVVDICEP